jgi:hypothetical protein
VVELPPEEEDLFFLEDTELGTAAEAFAHPFQASHPLSALASPARQTPSAESPPASTPPPAPKRPRRRLSPWLLIAIVCVVLVLGTLLFNALLPTTPPLQSVTATTASGYPLTPTVPPALATSPAMPTPSAPVAVPEPTWVPQALPAGWTDAGLSTSDALEAEQIAVAFAEREMSLDYRNMGTRTTHGGTMTASTGLLTPNAMQRFLHNDLRMMNNTLFDLVARIQLVRVAMGSTPQLLLFSTQGQQQFAWVDVSFQYWISQVDAQTGQHSEGMELIAGTHLPRSHHLGVLLLRVAPTASQGIGWLVSNYALDLPVGMLPDVVQPA